MTDIPPDEVLPCGCIIGCAIIEGVRTVTYVPCHTTCVNYRNAMDLAHEVQVPVEQRMGP